MFKVAIRSPGEKPWTRKTEILEYRTFFGVLQQMAADLRKRGVTHVVMEASGVYTEPVYYALCEQDFTQVAVINPAHAKALKGHKTDAKDCARLAELFECGLLHGSYIPALELKEVRDLTRYRIKTVQARTSEIQRLGKALESAGIKLGSVASSITGTSSTAMIEALIHGERRGGVLADLAIGRMRTAGKLADLSMALAGRFTEHHALLCRLHLDRIKVFDDAVDGLAGQIAAKAAPWQRELDLLKTLPGSGTQWRRRGWPRSAPLRICTSPATRSSPAGSPCARGTTSAPKSASTAGPGMPAPTSSRCWSRPPGTRSGSGAGCRPSTTGWSALGGQNDPAAKKKAITAIAHTLLKIAYQVLKSGTPYQDLGADFYTRRESPQQKQAYLERQLQKLHPGCTITVTISPPEGALPPRRLTSSPDSSQPGAAAEPGTRPSRRTTDAFPAPSPPLRPGFAAARPARTQLSCQSATATGPGRGRRAAGPRTGGWSCDGPSLAVVHRCRSGQPAQAAPKVTVRAGLMGRVRPAGR